MSNSSPLDPPNPFSPPIAEPALATAGGRVSFHDYRRACLEHESFLRCVGLADLLCACGGAVWLAILVRNLLNRDWQASDVPPFYLIRLTATFMFMAALIGLLLILGIELPRRRLARVEDANLMSVPLGCGILLLEQWLSVRTAYLLAPPFDR